MPLLGAYAQDCIRDVSGIASADGDIGRAESGFSRGRGQQSCGVRFGRLLDKGN